VVETDGWLNPDDLFVDWLNPRSDALSHPPRVTAYGPHTFRLYKWPEGLYCSPPAPPPPYPGSYFCDYVAVTFNW
jgi:hypothetical protein